ncbi:hypothetical protein EMIHUDRAFT_452668 [Emiliania huxleyi CCMP1516]|uniref:Ribosomal RNA large subunit methyltransferase K/L-like methyltransferase domain-containing protein n=2 Tax=Emiliania huxleyi TaxID=2903 RepID=A0A0D3IGP9_EMIH1|nr:hypothetical protein EMIHUDRAFT_452668 [Emiliania huxleyi CCMP1516]EOD10434.1 hypothetical protein EMIHUDRAFT_452668 [Emiliania huxleyi CCMP1516]|eukprot:XP_005762863.1 hypothetical protein EMIHUDRAFT_452668 [Emiliania huxleyi CCMP1516]
MLLLPLLAAPALRLFVSKSLSISERSAATTALREAAGDGRPLRAVQFDSPRRSLLISGEDDEDETLRHHIVAALDAVAHEPHPPSPVFVAVTTEPQTAEGAADAVERAVHADIEAFGLREPLRRRPSPGWALSDVTPALHAVLVGALHAVLDGAAVGGRWDVSSLVAVDGLVDEKLRAGLLSLLHGPSWPPENGADPDYSWQPRLCADPDYWCDGSFSDTLSGGPASSGVGLRPARLAALEAGPGLLLAALCAEGRDTPPAVAELEARVGAYLRAVDAASGGGGVDVCRMPKAAFGPEVTPLAANAPVSSDGEAAYGWHIDADPALLPPSPWTDCFGRYPNRSPGKPRFVTALVYLSPEWRRAIERLVVSNHLSLSADEPEELEAQERGELEAQERDVPADFGASFAASAHFVAEAGGEVVASAGVARAEGGEGRRACRLYESLGFALERREAARSLPRPMTVLWYRKEADALYKALRKRSAARLWREEAWLFDWRGGLRVHLRCRAGLEGLLAEEAGDLFRVVRVRRGGLVAAARRAWRLEEAYRLRRFDTLGFEVGRGGGGEQRAVDAEHGFVYSNQRWRGHGLNCIHFYPPSLVSTRCSEYSAQHAYSRPEAGVLQHTGQHYAGVHPPLAAAMARLAGEGAAEGRTMLIEAAIARPAAVRTLVGTDVAPAAVSLATANVAEARRRKLLADRVGATRGADSCYGCAVLREVDFREGVERIPELALGGVSLVVSNPPFGQRVKVRDLRALYTDLFAASAAVLRGGGRLVLINPRRVAPEGLAAEALSLESRRTVELGLRRAGSVETECKRRKNSF